LFEKKVQPIPQPQIQTQVQTQQIKGSVVQAGAGHSIGQTLRKYGPGGVTVIPQQPIPLVTQKQGGLFPITTQPTNIQTGITISQNNGATYIPPKVQIN
jgi:hypothetical protein